MGKRIVSFLLILCMLLTLTASAEAPLTVDDLRKEIDAEAMKELNVLAVEFEISPNGQSFFINRPQIESGAECTIAYNIYDSDSNPVNYFYSDEERVAATPGYAGLFNVFIVVTNPVTGEQDIQNIGWHQLVGPNDPPPATEEPTQEPTPEPTPEPTAPPALDPLTVAPAAFEISEDGLSFFINRPAIEGGSGEVTVAYNIYDGEGSAVNYFYSDEERAAATPGYAGHFNVFIVVTDLVTGESDTQDIGWHDLGTGPEPTEEPLPTSNPMDFIYRVEENGEVTISVYEGVDEVVVVPETIDDKPVTAIDNYAFMGCLSSGIVMHEGIRSIGDYAFARSMFQEVNVPDSVTEMGDAVFILCSELESVRLGAGVKAIGRNTFANCDKLVSIYMSKNMAALDASDFVGTSALAHIVIEEGNPVFRTENDVVFTADMKTLVLSPASKTEAYIPDSVTAIGGYAFHGSVKISEIVLPEGVTEIGPEAFDRCSGITSITIPAGVTVIDDRVFNLCTNLSEINLPDSITTIKEASFSRTGITRFVGPANLKEIGKDAFSKCASLQEAVLPETVTSIGTCAFEQCTSLNTFTLPGGLTEVGEAFLTECTGIETIILSGNLSILDGAWFRGLDNLKNFAVTEDCTNYAAVDGAILTKDLTTLVCVPMGRTEYVFPEGITAIADNALMCSKLTSIDIPSTVTSIGNAAFTEMKGLKTAVLPDSVTNLGTSLFEFDASLESVRLPQGLLTIPDDCFSRCGALASIEFPDGVTSIGDGAFSLCGALKVVVLPAGLEKIGSSAFRSTGVREIEIPATVKNLEDAFGGCSSLISVTLHEGLETIAADGFESCSMLRGIVIPDSVTTIGNDCFCFCGAFVSFRTSAASKLTSIGEDVFFGCSDSLVCYGPAGGALEAYCKNNSLIFAVSD